MDRTLDFPRIWLPPWFNREKRVHEMRLPTHLPTLGRRQYGITPDMAASYVGPMKQVLPSVLSGLSTTTKYVPISCSTSSPGAVEDSASNVMPCGGTLTNLRVKLSAAPSGAETRTIKVYKNGSATTLTCTITGAATTGADTTHTITVAAGDTVSVEWSASASAADSNPSYFVLTFTASSTSIYGVLLARNIVSLDTSATEYITATEGASNVFGTSVAQSQSVVPTGGTISNMYVQLRTAPGGAASRAFTLMLNGSPTALTCTVSTSGQTANDTTHSVAVVAGDLICWKEVPSGTPAGSIPAVSAQWTPTIGGESIWMLTAPLTPSGASATYNFARGSCAWNAAENIFSVLMDAATIKKMYAQVTTAPSSGKSRAYTARLNGSPGALTCTIADTAVSANDTVNTMSAVAGDLLAVQTAPSGTPTGAGINQLSLVLLS